MPVGAPVLSPAADPDTSGCPEGPGFGRAPPPFFEAQHEEEEEPMTSSRALLASGVRIALDLMPETTNVRRATRLGVSTRTLYEWRNGSTEPTPENITRLANVSGMTEEDIRNGRLAD